MTRRSAPGRIASAIAVTAVALALALGTATAAHASDASSASKLEAAINQLRADNGVGPYLRNTHIDSWLEAGVKKVAEHSATENCFDALPSPPQGPAGFSCFTVKVANPTVAKALAMLETYDGDALLSTEADFGPAAWVTKGSWAYVGFSTVSYANLPWQTIGTVRLPSHPLNGTTIVPKLSGWSPAPDSYQYNWFISGGPSLSSDPTFTPDNAQIGHRIRVEVTAVKSGYQTPGAALGVTRYRTADGTIHGPRSLVVDGTRSVGDALTVLVGTWTPAVISFRFQWYRSDHAISGADARNETYVLTAADSGKRIDVRVTGYEVGYSSDSVRTHTSTRISS